MQKEQKKAVLPDPGDIWRLFLQSRAEKSEPRRTKHKDTKPGRKPEKAEKKRRKTANASRARNRQYVQSRRTRRLKGSRHHS